MSDRKSLPSKQIVDCEFSFKCPLNWYDLTGTENPKTRFCGECRQNVHFAETDEELAKLKTQGACVAVWTPNALPKQPPVIMMGMIPPPEGYKSETTEWKSKNEKNLKKSWLNSLSRWFSRR